MPSNGYAVLPDVTSGLFIVDRDLWVTCGITGEVVGDPDHYETAPLYLALQASDAGNAL